VIIYTSYGAERPGFDYPAKAIIFYLQRSDRLWRPLSLLYTMGPGIKWPGPEADHSPPTGVEVKISVELYLHSPPYLFHIVKVKLSLCVTKQTLRHEGVRGSGCICHREMMKMEI
jgi:hypothetical protein